MEHGVCTMNELFSMRLHHAAA